MTDPHKGRDILTGITVTDCLADPGIRRVSMLVKILPKTFSRQAASQRTEEHILVSAPRQEED
jgi:hypothetical protein